ncbi:MAG: hypothetical protein ACK2T0_08425, partial [Anaerolineales bacterium]
MAQGVRRGKSLWIACSIIALGICGIGVLGGVYMFTSFGKAAPIVEILQPQDRVAIESGAAIVLTARGESSLGIQKIEFLADGIAQDDRDSGGSAPRSLEAAFPWFSSKPGVHKLSVVAYDRVGTASAPASVMVVVSARTLQTAAASAAEGGESPDAASPGEGEEPEGPLGNEAGSEGSPGEGGEPDGPLGNQAGSEGLPGAGGEPD